MIGIQRIIGVCRQKRDVLTFLRALHNRYIDYYEVLGVNRYADIKEIKLGYFKMAKKFHPDSNKTLDAKQMFELVAEAYDVLSDDKRRQDYDDTGQSSERFGGRAHGPARHSTDSTYTAEQMYSKIFNTDQAVSEDELPHEDFAVSYSGANVSREYVATVHFEEAITGTDLYLNIRVAGTCNKCLGDRAEMGYSGRVCPYCEGTGEETIKTGHVVGRRQCSYCNGEKIFYKYKCLECEGIGRIVYERPYKITIPPGSEHGQVFRFEIDNSLLGIPEEKDAKDRFLYVTLNVKECVFFDRDGMDLISHMRLSPALALLGGNIEYTGLTRVCDLDVSDCTSSHSTLIIHKAGVCTSDYAGDHILKAVIKVPKKLTWRQRRCFLPFASLDLPVNGIVNGVHNELDHKFNVNVVEADEIINTVLKGALFNEHKEKWHEKFYRKTVQKIEMLANFQFT